MSEDPIRKYLDAKSELDATYSKVQKLQTIITDVASALNKPYSFMVSNVGVGFPPEVAMARVPSLNADDWPSAKQLAETLASLHNAYKQVENSWMAIPQVDRKNLTPPPSR